MSQGLFGSGHAAAGDAVANGDADRIAAAAAANRNLFIEALPLVVLAGGEATPFGVKEYEHGLSKPSAPGSVPARKREDER
jgi:hypothetical protein